MLWHISIASQPLTPRGQVAMTCSERPCFSLGSEFVPELGRWRR